MRNQIPEPESRPSVEPRRTEAGLWCNACGGCGPARPASDRRSNGRPGAASVRSLFCEACGRVRPFWLRPRAAVRRLAAFGLISPPARVGKEVGPLSGAESGIHREEHDR